MPTTREILQLDDYVLSSDICDRAQSSLSHPTRDLARYVSQVCDAHTGALSLRIPRKRLFHLAASCSKRSKHDFVSVSSMIFFCASSSCVLCNPVKQLLPMQILVHSFRWDKHELASAVDMQCFFLKVSDIRHRWVSIGHNDSCP